VPQATTIPSFPIFQRDFWSAVLRVDPPTFSSTWIRDLGSLRGGGGESCLGHIQIP